MSTHCLIAINVTINGNPNWYKYVYCHFDGYQTWVGNTLKQYYNTEEKIHELMMYGDMSRLDKNIEDCRFYHDDYKEDYEKVKAKNIESKIMLQDKMGDYNAYYLYIFENGEWETY